MMITYDHFFNEDVTSLTTDRSFDFTQKWPDGRLSNKQKNFLNEKTGINISGDINIKQVHSANILLADKEFNRDVVEADGIITDQFNLPIVIRTADCLPVFLYGCNRKCIGIMHCGWRSTQKKILQKAVNLMKNRFGCKPEEIKAAFGPSIRKCCYQVKEEFVGFFKDVYNNEGSFYFDLAGENRSQLIETGVDMKNIYDSEICTCCDTEYFSFRREGEKAGRLLSLMVMRA